MIAGWYTAALGTVDGFEAPNVPPWARPNYQSYLVRIPDSSDQRAVMQHLLDRGVSSRRGIMCAHRERPYAGSHELPHSEASQDRHIVLPLFGGMTEGDVDRVVTALAGAAGGGVR
jgi:dTDP-4-amino-4,6-dideoxygalactose transaminase